MKSLLLSIIALSAIYSCSGRKGEMRITGNIDGMNDARLTVFSPDDGIVGIDTIIVKDGRLDWACECSAAEATYVIVYPNMSTLTVFGGSGQVARLNGSARNLSEMEVSGSEANDDYSQLRKEMSANPGLADSLCERYISSHRESLLANHLEHERASQSIPPSLRQGAKLPKFSLRMRNGKTVTSVELRGKYVLLTFWACWRGNSHSTNYQIRKLRRESKVPFECISYSLDINTQSLASSERYDSISWHSYCDQQGFASKLASRLGVRDIPYYVLVDKKGIIIESSRDIEDIRLKIQTLQP